MKRALLLLLPIAVLSGCASENSQGTVKPSYSGGDGSSARQAVIAVGDGDRWIIAGEWLERRYPGCFIKSEFSPPGAPSGFVVFRVRTRTGKMIDVWFKITYLHPVIVTTNWPNQPLQPTAGRSDA